MNYQQAYAHVITVRGKSYKAGELRNDQLEWVIVNNGETDGAAAASILAKRKEDMEKARVPASALVSKTPPPPAPEPSEYEQFIAQEEVELPAPPPVKSMAFVPNTPSLKDVTVPEWAKRIEAKIDALLEHMHSAPAQAAPAAGGGDTGTFIPETIEAKKESGRLSFRLKGGVYKKHGVVAWPEVIEAAGLKPHLFPIGEEQPFTGYVAHFVWGDPNEDNKRNPRKVVTLVKQ